MEYRITTYKCCHRIRLEERIASNDQTYPQDEKCEDCCGYMGDCPDYVNINHLLHFYEMFGKNGK